MIHLIGGKYDGKRLRRERLPIGDVIAIVVAVPGQHSDAEAYQMSPDGDAYVVAQNRPWHAVAEPKDLS
jgi:hypothetical protein